MPLGERNAYVCSKCKQSVITIDKDEGVTPFMMNCRATPGCTGDMRSEFYCGPLLMSDTKPTFEWRKPTEGEYLAASPAMQDHFDQGGLDIYSIKEGQ